MKQKLIFILSLFVLLIVGQSCSKDEASPIGGSRDVKYEITGNFAGKIDLVATTNNSDFEIIEITKLPWKLEFTAKSSIKFVIAQGIGASGTPGQTATLKTFIGGKEIESSTGTVLSTGVISLTNKQIILK